uniref:peroxidase n=1 Tax=Daucus carota subsp. sativus TaxID=79200 RepID=A0A164WWE4_DAUCS
MEEKNNSCIILYPSPGIGHLIAMVELAKLVLCRYPDSFSEFIILMTTAPHLNTATTAPYTSHVSATTPSITFYHLPTTPLPSNYVASVEGLNFDLQSFNNPNVRQALETISSKAHVKAFVMDMFCSSASDVASAINIPTYYFFTSAAASLSILLYLPTLHQKNTTSFKDLNAFIQFPGIPPIFSSDMSNPLLDRNSMEYKYFMELAAQMAKSDGIIINTFHSLEPRAITAISDGLCTPNSPIPPIYCIGPLIAEKQTNSKENECLVWLNSQPSKSVIFLCFGSMGVFCEEQLEEIAVGLEKSGHRFLWVVKTPPPKECNESNTSILGLQGPDLSRLLPQGFLERTKGRGGCDASILIDSTQANSAEKEAVPNQTVRGYELIDEAKKNLEVACPSTVSCADIITMATRDSVALAGGPNYTVPTGRRDGLVSNEGDVNLPSPRFTVPQALRSFSDKGLTLNDMVTLLGAHTVGFAHCSFFRSRLSSSGRPDPTMDPALDATLSKLCGPADSNPRAFLDQNTSLVFDNQYYHQVMLNRGVLHIDQQLSLDKSSAPMVSNFAKNGAVFQQSFANAMVKMGSIQVVVGTDGEIRKNCRAFN